MDLRRPRLVLARRSRGISAAVCGSSSRLFAGDPPPFAATSSPGPFVAHVSPLVSLLAPPSSSSSPLVLPNPSDLVREPATMPTTREPAVDGVSAEWSSAPCTTAEMELIIHLRLLDMEEDLIDWETELEYEMPPLLPPSSPLVPSSPEGASDSPVPAPRQRLLLASALRCLLLASTL